MRTPNLFDYATKELSQDAMICWLIAWSQTEPEDECGRALQDLGRAFVNALLGKHDVALAGGIRCPECTATPEIYQQDQSIDVLARIKDESATHVLLIEDKTDTHDHSDQLERYYDAVTSRKTRLGEVSASEVRPIYLKTGHQSRAQDQAIEKNTAFRVFNRRDFLDVLSTYRGAHPLVTDFQEHLERREAEFNSYEQWKHDDDRTSWSWGAWEGFYRRLEDELHVEGEQPPWGSVSNPSGGFLGFWWHWKSVADADSLYLQLEVSPGEPDKQKLCFKVETSADRSAHPELKQKYHRLILDSGSGQVEKPQRMRVGQTMTVAVWQGDWFVFNPDGSLDIDGTVTNLRQAERIIDDAACGQ